MKSVMVMLIISPLRLSVFSEAAGKEADLFSN